MNKIINFLTSLPDFGSDLRNQKAHFLNFIIFGVGGITILSIPAILLVSQYPDYELLFLILWPPILLILQILLRRGYLELSSYLFSFCLLAMINIGSLFFGGVIGPNLGTYMAAPLITGLILGITGGLIFAGLSIASALLLIWLELTGMVVFPNPPAQPDAIITGFVITTLFVAIITFYYYRFLELTLKRVYNQAQEQSVLNQKLQEIQTQLEEKSEQLAISNQILEARVFERTREIETISKMVQELHACSTLEDAYPILRARLIDLFPAFSGRMWMVQPDQNTFFPVLQWGNDLPSIKNTPSMDCQSIQTGQFTFHLSPQDDSHCFQSLRGTEKSSVCLPLKASGSTLGMLQLWNANPMFGWDEEIQKEKMVDFERLITTITHQMAIALRHLYLHMELQQQVIHDDLTGLYNRRFMEDALYREISRANRKGHEIGLALLDVDYFKQYNDTYGHEAGDQILREIGAYLKLNLRKEDVACRIGGEEFLLIFPDISQESLQKRMDEIIKGIHALRLLHHDQNLGTITVSAGAAMYPLHGAMAQELVRSADLALYQSKNAGRNQVTFYNPLKFSNLDKGTEFSSLSSS